MSKQDWCYIPIRVQWQGSRYWRELHAWLQQHVHDWDYEPVTGPDAEDRFHKTIWFARERDAVMFALKWS